MFCEAQGTTGPLEPFSHAYLTAKPRGMALESTPSFKDTTIIPSMKLLVKRMPFLPFSVTAIKDIAYNGIQFLEVFPPIIQLNELQEIQLIYITVLPRSVTEHHLEIVLDTYALKVQEVPNQQELVRISHR